MAHWWSWRGAVALALALSLGVGWSVALVVVSVSPDPISTDQSAVLATIGGALATSLAGYLGYMAAEHRRHSDEGTDSDHPR